MVLPTSEAREHVVKKFGAIEGGKQTLTRLDSFLAQKYSPTKPFVISRTLNAPRELVWKVFTDPEHMSQWWGPKGFTVIASKMDLRTGGMYHYGLRASDGSEMWGRCMYRKIDAPKKLVFINSFSDEKGGLTRHPGHQAWPLEMLTIYTFEEKDGKTVFTIEWMPINASASEVETFDKGRASMTQGWSGTISQLEEYLKAQQVKK